MLPSNYSKTVDLGGWSKAALNQLLRESSRIKSTGGRVDYLSAFFVDTPYKKSSLIGDTRTEEKLVISFSTFDCFTFVDSVEALRLSRSFEEVAANFIRIRYRDSLVQYHKRKHFFTDWSIFNSAYVTDKTADIGTNCTRTICKRLNVREDGSEFVENMEPVERNIRYIPSGKLDASVFKLLRNGDYIGIASDLAGLDVSHVGILIKARPNVILRHASSTLGKVVEQDFLAYVRGKPGIIVLRPHKEKQISKSQIRNTKRTIG